MALVLRLGHRRSLDLDLFSATDAVPAHTRLERIHSISVHPARIIENVDGGLLLLVDGLDTGFFRYGQPLLEPVQTVENVVLLLCWISV
jgi:hypothetical protein